MPINADQFLLKSMLINADQAWTLLGYVAVHLGLLIVLQLGECISGAICWKDLVTITQNIGFSKPRLVSATRFDFKTDSFKEVLGMFRRQKKNFSNILYYFILWNATKKVYNIWYNKKKV